MAYLEKDFQTDFNKWCKHIYQKTAVFELKISRGASLPYRDVKEHQENALYTAKHGSVVYKIPDTGYQNPFDSFMMVEVPAYIVIMFRAKQAEFILIDIDRWLYMKQNRKRESITEDQAKEIGTIASLKTAQRPPAIEVIPKKVSYPQLYPHI